MGIALNAVYLLMQATSDSDRTPDRQVLTLGVQDCYFTKEELESFLKRHRFPCQSQSETDIEYTAGFRHLGPDDRQRLAKNLHQRTLFRFLGYDPKKVFSLDVNDFEGCDIVHDLNEPVPRTLHNNFDLIVDAGTIEHVFSLRDAFFNMARMCRVGGLVIHFAPVDMVNHGFVNLNSYIFQDFYESNGFERVYLSYIGIPIKRGEENHHFLEFDPFLLREPLRAPYYLAAFAAYRKLDDIELKVPLQGFYRELFEKSAGIASSRLPGPGAICASQPSSTGTNLPEHKSLKSKGAEQIRRLLNLWLSNTPQPAPPSLPPHGRIEL